MRRYYAAMSTCADRGRAILRLALALAYGVAGCAHILSPGGFLAITPAWVPFPERVIFLTGLCEIAGAVGLLIPPARIGWARRVAGTGLALYALCVWPANLNHAVNDIPLGGVRLSWWYHGPRLAFQPVLIWAALWAAEVIDWPWRKGRRT